MPKKLYILPYVGGSRSVNNLAQEIGAKKIKLRNSQFRPSPNKVVVNWGNSKPPVNLDGGVTLNTPAAIRVASNKLKFFELCSLDDTIRIPEFTTDKWTAERWIMYDKEKVCARTKLTGHSGDGLVLVSDLADPMPRAPLYTKYIKKKDEYRVHLFKGEVVDVQRKARRNDAPDEDVNWQVRNHQNGFVYVRGEVNPPEDVITQAKKAFNISELDFGAVDVIYNERQDKAYVLEINTAPGLEGQTLENYKKFLTNFLEAV